MAANCGSRNDADQNRRFGGCPQDTGESAGKLSADPMRPPSWRRRSRTRATRRRRSKLPSRSTTGTGFGSSLGLAAAAIYRAGEFDSATKLLEGIDDLSERARAYLAAGRSMIEGGGGKQLAAWIDANQSDLARTFACLGAAEALSQENVK